MLRFRTPLLVLLSLVVSCSLGVGVLYLCIGVSEGGLTWLSPAIKQKIEVPVCILLWPARFGGLPVVVVFYALLIFVALSWLLRKRDARRDGR